MEADREIGFLLIARRFLVIDMRERTPRNRPPDPTLAVRFPTWNPILPEDMGHSACLSGLWKRCRRATSLSGSRPTARSQMIEGGSAIV